MMAIMQNIGRIINILWYIIITINIYDRFLDFAKSKTKINKIKTKKNGIRKVKI